MQECCGDASGESQISLCNQHWQITEAVMVHSSNCICYLGDGVNGRGPHCHVRASCQVTCKGDCQVEAKAFTEWRQKQKQSPRQFLENWPILIAGHSTLLLGPKPHVSCQKRQPSTDVFRARDTICLLNDLSNLVHLTKPSPSLLNGTSPPSFARLSLGFVRYWQ